MTPPRSASLRPLHALAVLTLIACAAPAHPQAAPPGMTLQHVRGVVLNSLDSKPIARVLVVSGDQRMATMTDDQGRFSFDVRFPTPAASTLTAQSTGFNQQRMSVFLRARRPGYTQLNYPVQIAVNDPSTTDLTLKLVPESVLCGHVSASGGDLPPNLFGQLRRKIVQDGSAVWVQVNGIQVNSRGDFRIAELQPGDYKLMVLAWTQRRGTAAQPIENSPGFLPAFNNGAGDLASANPIHLGPGQTVDVNLEMRPATFYHVTIPIIGLAPGSGISATVGPADGSSGFPLNINSQGARLEGMLPSGAYDVRVTSNLNPPPGATAQPPTTITGWGRIEVSGGLVTAAPIALSPAAVVPVIVHDERTATQPDQNAYIAQRNLGQQSFQRNLQQIRPVEVTLRSIGVMGRGAVLRNNTSPNDPLVLENVVEGTYQVDVAAHQGYVAAVTSNGIDLLREPFVVGSGGAAGAIEITLRDDSAKLSGSVVIAGDAATNAIPADGSVLPIFIECIPLDHPFGRAVMGGGSTNGQFSFTNLAPGQYLLLASTNAMQAQSYEFRNPDVLPQLQAKGTLVTLTAGQKSAVQVPLLPNEEN